MAMRYYAYRYRLDAKDRYLIWYTNNRDGVIVEQSGLIPVFATLDVLFSYAVNHGMHVEPEVSELCNLDEAQVWVNHPEEKPSNCVQLLNIVNLFNDIGVSLGLLGSSRTAQLSESTYDKLFWGSNLPSITPLGAHYFPNFSVQEVAELSACLQQGLDNMHTRVAFL